MDDVQNAPPNDFYTETVVAEYDWQLKCARDPWALRDLKNEWGML